MIEEDRLPHGAAPEATPSVYHFGDHGARRARGLFQAFVKGWRCLDRKIIHGRPFPRPDAGGRARA